MDVQTVTQQLLKIASGGAPSWIATSFFGLAGLLMYFWWKYDASAAAQETTQKEKEIDQAATAQINQNISASWDKAAETVAVEELEDEKDPPK